MIAPPKGFGLAHQAKTRARAQSERPQSFDQARKFEASLAPHKKNVLSGISETIEKDTMQTYEKIQNIYEMRDDLIKNHLKKIGDYTEM